MLTFTREKFLSRRLRRVASCKQLNLDLVAFAIVIDQAAEVTLGLCDPHATVHLAPFTTVTEDRKHTIW